MPGCVKLGKIMAVELLKYILLAIMFIMGVIGQA